MYVAVWIGGLVVKAPARLLLFVRLGNTPPPQTPPGQALIGGTSLKKNRDQKIDMGPNVRGHVGQIFVREWVGGGVWLGRGDSRPMRSATLSSPCDCELANGHLLPPMNLSTLEEGRLID